MVQREPLLSGTPARKRVAGRLAVIDDVPPRPMVAPASSPSSTLRGPGVIAGPWALAVPAPYISANAVARPASAAVRGVGWRRTRGAAGGDGKNNKTAPRGGGAG